MVVGYSYQPANIQFQGCIVALLCVVEMDEEEYVCPDVVLIIDVMIKPLKFSI